MAKFESTLGTKEVDGGSFRTFSVSDETQPSQESLPDGSEEEKNKKLASLEAKISEARRLKLNNLISPEAKRRIEILTGIGRATLDVNVGDNVFTLRTLTGYEQRELALLGFTLAKHQRGDFQFEIRSQILARSLATIDGQSFSDIVGSDDLDIRMMGLEQLDDAILILLMTKYQELTKENNNKFGINTEDDVKEVVEDLKKA